MLRNRVPVWRKNENVHTSGVNNIMKSGNYIMTKLIPNTNETDPGIPVPEIGYSFAGSHYWIDHRTLYIDEDHIPEKEHWFSQIAYSYFNPCLGVRCKSGIGSGITESKWNDWEFTVMSGIHRYVTYATLNGVPYELKFKKHRNSDIVSLNIYLNGNTEISNYIKYGIRLKFDCNPIPKNFRPIVDRIIPVCVCGLRNSGFGRADCVLVIQPNGEIWLYNEYGDTDSRDYSVITSGFECFYSIS